MDFLYLARLLFVGALFLGLSSGGNEKQDSQSNESMEKIDFGFGGRFLRRISKGGFQMIKNMNISRLMKLNEIKDKYDFSNFFGVSRINTRLAVTSDSSEAMDAVNAGCTPLLTPVPLHFPNNNEDAYFPSCVLLERCSGCCYGDLLECRPTKTEEVYLKVMRVTAVMSEEEDRSRRQTAGSEIIVTEKRHLACACQCGVTELDCDPQTQIYDQNDCSCKCSNREKYTACLQSKSLHFWDSQTCSCACHRPLDCSSGEIFDVTECSCKKQKPRSINRSVDFASING